MIIALCVVKYTDPQSIHSYGERKMARELTIRKARFLGVFEYGGIAELLGLRTAQPVSQKTELVVKEEWVEIAQYGCLYVTLSLNLIGDTCLRINLLTKRAFAEAMEGDIIEVVTDNLSSVETIPFMSPNYNGVHLATCQDAQCWRIYVQINAGANREAEEKRNGSDD